MAKRSTTKLTNRSGYWTFVDQVPDTGSNDNPNETHDGSNSEGVVDHPRFFFDNVLVAIQIEKTRFNVHKYQLAKSEVFSDMFKLPKPTGGEPEEGSSPEHPIVIKGVAASDFAALLTVLYASHFSSNQPVPEASLVIPAFRLANLFDFSELRTYLLPLAEKNLDNVDKVVFAREFNIKDWLAPAHTRLCERETPLNIVEARKLGVDSVLMISLMRERYPSRGASTTAVSGNVYCQSCSGMTYYTQGHSNCAHCKTTSYGYYLRYNEPGAIRAKPSTNNTTLEAEVKKWVEEGFPVVK